MDAELNAQFVRTLSDWLEGDFSFKDMNQHLPEVADAIFENDETGMAQPFSEIEDRLTSALLKIVQDNECGNILVVTHAFMIKTLLFLFAPDKLQVIEKISNTDIFQLQYEDGVFQFA